MVGVGHRLWFGDDSSAYIYCALYYYCISSTSDHQSLDSRAWGPLVCKIALLFLVLKEMILFFKLSEVMGGIHNRVETGILLFPTTVHFWFSWCLGCSQRTLSGSHQFQVAYHCMKSSRQFMLSFLLQIAKITTILHSFLEKAESISP